MRGRAFPNTAASKYLPLVDLEKQELTYTTAIEAAAGRKRDSHLCLIAVSHPIHLSLFHVLILQRLLSPHPPNTLYSLRSRSVPIKCCISNTDNLNVVPGVS